MLVPLNIHQVLPSHGHAVEWPYGATFPVAFPACRRLVTSALGRDQNERRILTRTFDAVEEEFDHFDRFKSSCSNEPTQRRRRYTFQRLDHFFPFLSSFLVLP